MTHRMLGSGWSRCLMLQRKKVLSADMGLECL